MFKTPIATAKWDGSKWTLAVYWNPNAPKASLKQQALVAALQDVTVGQACNEKFLAGLAEKIEQEIR